MKNVSQNFNEQYLPFKALLIYKSVEQQSDNYEGQATDIEITAKQILKLRERLNRMLARNTGQKFEKIEKDVERDFFMTADEAKKYGIVDQVYK